MNILALCFFPAFVPIKNGGQSRLFNFYRALSQWHNITLLTSTDPDAEEEVIQHGINFIERRIPKDIFFIKKYQELKELSSGMDISAPTIAACANSPTKLHKAYLEEYEHSDIICHDFPFTADYDIFVGTDNKLRVYNAHNCETLLYRQLHPSTKSNRLIDIIRNAEQRMLNQSDIVLYCNEGDLEAFNLLAPNSQFEAIYAPNGMTPIEICYRTEVKSAVQLNAVFMGSLHLPNIDAAEFITNCLAPKFPNIIFHIIGSCIPDGNYPSNLIRHGILNDSDKKRILSLSNFALNPICRGSGSNVKVLEYFAYGIPVISTSFGVRGIHALSGTHFLEASMEDFGEVIGRAIHSKKLLVEIGNAGKELALQNYTWDAIARPVAERLTSLVDIKSKIPRRFVLALNDYDSFSGIGGGGTRTRGLYETTSEWCPVVFICFSDDGQIRSRVYTNGIIVINIPKTPEHLAELDRINSQFYVSANDIIASQHCEDNPWLNAIYQILRQSARFVVIEHCYLVNIPLKWGDRFIYSSHNHESELKKTQLEWHPLKSELISAVQYIESIAVEMSAATITVSDNDALSLVKGKRTSGPIVVVRNGASSPIINASVTRMKQEISGRFCNRSVIFLGSAHMPNVESAKFIVSELAKQCKDVHFHIVGAVCSAIQQAPQNVTLWGMVDEVTKSAIMMSSSIALNPIYSGSGSNVKLADYLGNGLFVISTEFGLRGYPESVREHVAIEPITGFADSILRVLDCNELFTPEAKMARRVLFNSELTMRSIAKRFVETLQDLESCKKRILYVAYRYTSPAAGGAEVNIEKFVRALGNSGKYYVDVVAPEISGIQNHMRFSEIYRFDTESGAAVNVPNVRFARFPADAPTEMQIQSQLRKIWLSQPKFEQLVNDQLQDQYNESGLTWGWGSHESHLGAAARWMFCESGFYLHQAAVIELEGYSTHPVVTTVYCDERIIAGPWSINGSFALSFEANKGSLRLETSAPHSKKDPRPLAIRVFVIKINGSPLDFSSPTLVYKHMSDLPAEKKFRILDEAASITRVFNNNRLTDSRGPWSSKLDRYITDHVMDYDLIITHNNVFRTAVFALEEAKKQGVPSILIPHVHLDDDFYHFPDILESARNASLVLAAPKPACEFLAQKGCNVRYLPAGCDASESFTVDDQNAFKDIYLSSRPFILVLGRKAGAKGYAQIIDSINELNREGIDIQAVLIGPDEDGVFLDNQNTIYLGSQPRNVVRGALMSCTALCNMSNSESFGIVLLEAWMAGKPVIANKNCAAFLDIAIDNDNALLVSRNDLTDGIRRLISEPLTAKRLGKTGNAAVKGFDWSVIENQFLDMVHEITNSFK